MIVPNGTRLSPNGANDDSPGQAAKAAPPWVSAIKNIQALKGRNKKHALTECYS